MKRVISLSCIAVLLASCTTRTDLTYLCKADVVKQGEDVTASSACGDAKSMETLEREKPLEVDIQ